MQTPIPVTILTGFLGSGKTTLLNRIINAPHQQNIAVLVNDFGAINIDSQLIVDVQDDMISLANGCICCTIRGDFVSAVEQLVAREDRPDYIVVEASGVADPIDIALTFKSLSDVVIDSILALIDAEQIQSLKKEFAVIAMNQIGMADIVILNKVDLVTADQIKSVRQYIKQINKTARIFETQQGNIPLEFVLNVAQYDPLRLVNHQPQDIHVHEVGADHDHKHDDHHDHDHHHDDHTQVFSTWHWKSDDPVSVRALEQVLNQLPDTVYRAKGIFYTIDEPENRIVAQVIGNRVNIEIEREWTEDEARFSQFVVIASHDGFDPEHLRVILEKCTDTSKSKFEIKNLAGGLLSWLRGG
jgi:G3E family GTPase